MGSVRRIVSASRANKVYFAGGHLIFSKKGASAGRPGGSRASLDHPGRTGGQTSGDMRSPFGAEG
jgi:hypothetical protein